jgi:hypothetical protein
MNTTAAAPKAPIAPLTPKQPTAAQAGGAPKEPKAPKVPREPKESNFKKVYPDTAVITVKAASNPKRAGSKAHATFALYKTGGTVGEFLKAGGFYAALSWDVGHGFIDVK